MRKIIEAGNLSGKRVLVRDDFNITIDEKGNILDDFRIRASLPTLKYLLDNQAKIILISHFGRPEGKVVDSLRLTPILGVLSGYLSRTIKKAEDCIGPEAEKMVGEMKDGDILLLENLRFHPEEEKNDDAFAKGLAGLADVYVNDGFGVSHRAHASVVGIAKHLPSFAGFLLEKEVENLSRALNNPERPLVVVIGGAKISTKIKLIESYLEKADHVILGGALANTVLHAQGIAVGSSMIEEDVIPELKKLEITNSKLHIPVDLITSIDKTGMAGCKVEAVGSIKEGELILDIGPETESLFDSIVKSSKMVVWNGPMGLFENDKFSHGTKAMAESISSCNQCFSIVGGGETTCFVEKNGMIDKFNHVSTGGGAMLEFLAGDKLPGIEALK